MLVVAVAMLALAACEKKKKKEAGTERRAGGPGGAGATGRDQAAPPPAPGEARVELLASGADPRRPLRYQLKAGVSLDFVMVMRMNMQMTLNGTVAPVPEMPAMTMNMKLEVGEVTAAGARWSARVTSTEVAQGGNPSVVQAMSTAIAAMKGLSFKGTISPTGRMSDVQIEVPAGVPPQAAQMMDSMKQQMNQMAVPFPDEAVGVGAKWRVTQKLTANNVALTSVMENRLDSFEGQQAKVTVSLTQKAEKQKVPLPGTGMSADLTSMSGSGGGTLDYDLGKAPWPVVMDMNVDLDMAMSMQGSQEISMKMGMQVSGRTQ